jgi:hypothetical protein
MSMSELRSRIDVHDSPPLEEGWTRHQENIAKPPLMERTGWSLTGYVACERPPRLRRFGMGPFFYRRSHPSSGAGE